MCDDGVNSPSLLSTDHMSSGVSTANIFSFSSLQIQGKAKSPVHTALLADSTHITTAQALLL